MGSAAAASAGRDAKATRADEGRENMDVRKQQAVRRAAPSFA